MAWAITQSEREDIVTTQAPPKYSGVPAQLCRLPHRQSNVTMNSTAKSMAVSPGCLGLPPASLAGVFFEPVTERLSVSQ